MPPPRSTRYVQWMIASPPAWLTIAMITALAACAPAPQDAASRAHAIERRILAPCCRRQNLEDHDSEIARTLRQEVERRCAAGEAASAIEDDLAHRYGEDIRAMPRGADPLPLLSAVIAALVALTALSLRRFRHRAPRRPDPPRPPPERDDDADRLDDELLAAD
jgi:cytochrome c-type biogenesis protein CcmH